MFRLLTGRTVPDGRKPDESVEGMASIQDPRVDALSEVCKPQKTTYAENHFVLCPDVEEGTGRRDWLDAARRCDLVCLVVAAGCLIGFLFINCGFLFVRCGRQSIDFSDFRFCLTRMEALGV